MAIELGDAVLKLGIDKSDLDRGMGDVGSMIEKHRKAIGVGMATMGAGIMAGLGMAMKSAADFESAMREVNTMMGLSQNEFKAFSKEVQMMAADMGVDAVESAQALYQAISAGVPKENAIDFLRVATKAAIGGVTDTATAVDGLTTVINAFKMPIEDAERVADIMFTTVKGGKTTMEELSSSLFNVAPIAAASGVSFDEVSAALATMTKQGIPTNIATTSLRQALVVLQKPTVDMKKAMDKLGYASGQAMLKELGLAKTLGLIRDASNESNEELMKMVGSVEAGQAVLSLTGDSAEMFSDDLRAMSNATGAADEAFVEMENSAGRQMERMTESFQNMAITVGNVVLPILTSLLESIKPIIAAVTDWMNANPGLTKVIVLLTAALGALLSVGGSILIMLPSLVAGWTAFKSITIATTVASKAATAAQWLWNAALTANPIGLVVVAIGSLIAAGYLLIENWDAVASFFSDMWNGVVDVFKMAWENIRWMIFPIPMLLMKYWKPITGFFSNMWDGITSIFKAGTNGIIDMLNWLIKQMNKIHFSIPSWVPGVGGKSFGVSIPELPKWANGGDINEPTMLYGLKSMRPYAIAGEAGVEHVGPGRLNDSGSTGYKTANIYLQLDGETLAEVIGEPLVDIIRIKQGLKI